MIKPKEEVLKALSSLEHNNDFKVVMKWVHDSILAIAVALCDQPNEPQKSWMQGHVQVLKEFHNHVKDCEASLKNIQKGKADDIHKGGGMT
jgi:hypothetical protein